MYTPAYQDFLSLDNMGTSMSTLLFLEEVCFIDHVVRRPFTSCLTAVHVDLRNPRIIFLYSGET